MAVVCIGIGFYAIYRNKELHGKPHFTSYHGLAGAAVLTATAAVPAGGALAFKHLGLMRHAPEMRLALIKALHRRAGALTYFAATLVVALGLCTPAIHQVHLRGNCRPRLALEIALTSRWLPLRAGLPDVRAVAADVASRRARVQYLLRQTGGGLRAVGHTRLLSALGGPQVGAAGAHSPFLLGLLAALA